MYCIDKQRVRHRRRRRLSRRLGHHIAYCHAMLQFQAPQVEPCIRCQEGEDTSQQLRWGSIHPKDSQKRVHSQEKSTKQYRDFSVRFQLQIKSFNRNNTSVILFLSVGFNKRCQKFKKLCIRHRSNQYKYQKSEMISCRVCLTTIKANRLSNFWKQNDNVCNLLRCN